MRDWVLIFLQSPLAWGSKDHFVAFLYKNNARKQKLTVTNVFINLLQADVELQMTGQNLPFFIKNFKNLNFQCYIWIYHDKCFQWVKKLISLA